MSKKTKPGALSRTQLVELAAHVREVLIDNGKSAVANNYIDPHIDMINRGMKDAAIYRNLQRDIFVIKEMYSSLFFDETPAKDAE